MRKLESAAGVLSLLVLFFTASTQAEEEYYTWIDENGVVNYAQRNPQGFDARYVTAGQRFGYQRDSAQGQEPPAAEAAAPRPDPAAAIAQENRDIDAEIATEKARIDKEIASAKKSNCNIGKLNLAQLKNYNRIKVQGEDGQVRVLTEEEKQARIDRAMKTMSENCE